MRNQRTHNLRNLTCGSVICALWTASDACCCASPLWGGPCRGGPCPWESQLQQACHLRGPDPALQACPHPARSHTCSARSQPHEGTASQGLAHGTQQEEHSLVKLSHGAGRSQGNALYRQLQVNTKDSGSAHLTNVLLSRLTSDR